MIPQPLISVWSNSKKMLKCQITANKISQFWLQIVGDIDLKNNFGLQSCFRSSEAGISAEK